MVGIVAQDAAEDALGVGAVSPTGICRIAGGSAVSIKSAEREGRLCVEAALWQRPDGSPQ